MLARVEAATSPGTSTSPARETHPRQHQSVVIVSLPVLIIASRAVSENEKNTNCRQGTTQSALFDTNTIENYIDLNILPSALTHIRAL